MGTQVKIVFFTADSLKASNTADSAFSKIQELNSLLSDYLIESELSRLSATHGRYVKVSQDLWTVLFNAQIIARLSGGKFDVTSGPLTRLWRQARRRGTLPDSSDVLETITSVGFDHLQLNPENRSVVLKKENMRLDLGGIAKGYIADQVLKYLMQSGFHSVAVDVGGDIALGDPPINQDGWSVEVFDADGRVVNMILANCGIAVSGDTYRFIEYQGVRYSHLIDPQTGYGVTHQRKVAIIASSAMIADAWASVYSVMDWEAAVLDAADRDDLSVRLSEFSDLKTKEMSTGKFKNISNFK